MGTSAIIQVYTNNLNTFALDKFLANGHHCAVIYRIIQTGHIWGLNLYNLWIKYGSQCQATIAFGLFVMYTRRHYVTNIPTKK